MSNDDFLTELKQFIATTVSMQIAPVIERLDRLGQKVDDGFARMDDGFAGVGEAISNINDQMARDKLETGDRLTELEAKAA